MAETSEQQRAYNREYYQRNRERIRSYKQDPEQRRARNEQRRERWRTDDAYRETQLANARNYQQRNREQLRSYKQKYYLRNRDKALVSFTFNKHGLQPEDWAALWDAQDGRCYLCGDPMARTGKTGAHVDHDHSHCPPNSSCRICQRGLACMNCNLAIGMVADDPARLRRMADALEAAQAAVEHRKAQEGEHLTLF